MQPKYFITTYPYIFIMHTSIFVIHVFPSFFFYFQMCLVFKLLVGEISICYKVEFLEISGHHSHSFLIMVLIPIAVINSVWQKNKNKINNKTKIDPLS